MTQEKSLWSELQRERERRRRAARARERERRQQIRQMMQDRARAERRAAQADAAEARRQEQLAHEAGTRTARALRSHLAERMTELGTLLTSALAVPPELPFAALKRIANVPPFDPGDLEVPLPSPRWEEVAPSPPSALASLAGGRSRHARAKSTAWEAFQRTLADHVRAEDARVSELRLARAAHDELAETIESEVRGHNAAVDELERNVLAGMPDAVEAYFGEILALSEYPIDFPCEYRIAYRPQPRELVIEYRLPNPDVIPAAADFRYDRSRRELDEHARPVSEAKELYASVVRQLALRTMWECFAVRVTAAVIDAVVFSGVVQATNRATGHAQETHLISAHASRTTFARLVLDQLDPAACLAHLNAVVSPDPYGGEPVEPVIEFSRASYRLAEPAGSPADDAPPDLQSMDWYRFESLIRQLFEALDMDVRMTQSSREHGVEALAITKNHVVHRAEILIQARRHNGCVPAADVRALAGQVEEKRATAGVLITTAWVSQETRSFAARNNRLRIIEGGELRHLLAEYLGTEVSIGLADPPSQAA